MARRLKSDCRAPNAAAPRPMASRAKRGYPDCLAIARRARQRGEQRPSWDEYGDASRTMPHRARRGGYRLNFSSSPKATARAVLVSFSLSLEIANADPEENGTTHSPRNPTPSLGLLTHSATASSTITHLKGRIRGGGWRRKGTLHPILQPSSCVRSPPTPWLLRLLRSALQTELPTPRCLRPSCGGASDSAALITLYYKLRSLIWNPSTPFRERSSCDCMSLSLRLPTGLANSGAAPASL